MLIGKHQIVNDNVYSDVDGDDEAHLMVLARHPRYKIGY